MIDHVWLSVEMDSGNAAVIDDPRDAAAKALTEVALRIRRGDTDGLIRDINGNRIGSFALTVDEAGGRAADEA